MLHELLAACRGHSGLIFIEKNGLLRVNPCITQIHPCEEAIMNQLLTIASNYRYLTRFISKHRNSSVSAMYFSAFCQGLECSLDGYRQTLVQIERDILMKEGAQLSSLQHKMSPHRSVLQALVDLVKDIENSKPKGCMLLDAVYKASTCGMDGVGTALNMVLSKLHNVLFKQLLAWLLQGSLYDPYQEFFIVKDEAGDESILLGDEGEQSRSRSQIYRLEMSLVPDHISAGLAEKIFFIGHSIQMFESDRRVEVQGAVLREKEADFYRELARLRDTNTLNINDFNNFVNNIRETVSSHLHRLLMIDSNLVQELKLVWSVFLMGRGELFHTFIQMSDDRMSKPPTNTTQLEANQAWITSCRSMLSHSEEENITQKVTLLVGNEPQESWGQLNLQLAVSWPLHLVITPQAINKYNKIFGILLLLRRAGNSLQNMWSDVKFQTRARRSRVSNPAAPVKVEQTRILVTFIVWNIQSYVLSDVLESQKSKLLTKMQETKSFEAVRQAHEEFLSDVSAQIFLLSPKVLKILTNLLTACINFSRTSQVNKEAAVEMSEELDRRAKLLLQLLTSLRQQLQGNHLAQLLLRLDFNRHFSKTQK